MIKEAIINFINAWTDKIRPCKHEWGLINTTEYCRPAIGGKYVWTEFTYFCNKCGQSKKVSTE